jgi:hypothetical protein
VNAISSLAKQLKSPFSLIGHTTLLDKHKMFAEAVGLLKIVQQIFMH